MINWKYWSRHAGLKQKGHFLFLFESVGGVAIISVVDPHHFDADPDSTHHPDADPDSDFLFDADPTFLPDAYPDPYPSL